MGKSINKMDKEALYEQRYEALLQKYLRQLQERLNNLTSYWQEATEATNDIELLLEKLENTRSLAHGIAGSGETFGFSHVTENGRRLEQALIEEINRRKHDNSQAGQSLNRISELVDTLVNNAPT